MTQRIIKIRYTLQHEDTGRITQKVFSLDEIEARYALDWFESLGERWFVVSKDEWTGLFDKNGKEIYEGDIIHYKHETGLETWDEMDEEVKFENGMFSCAVYSNFEECDGEVIGNVWENGELIK